jgi:pimeloyl-ACP methyl ester carboxylesterase
MTETVEGAGVALAARARGAGTPVLLVHDLAADMRAWEPLAAALGDDARTLAYDRRGYGASGAPQPYERTTVQEQAEDARAVLDALGNGAMGADPHEPSLGGGAAAAGAGAHGSAPHRDALAVGDGFGALVVLDLLIRHPGRVKAAALIDPPAFPLVPEATEALSVERARLTANARTDGVAAALEQLRTDRGLPPAPAAAPTATLADLAGQSTLELTRRALRPITAPVTILVHSAAPAHVRAAADALAALLPNATRPAGEDLAAAISALLD